MDDEQLVKHVLDAHLPPAPTHGGISAIRARVSRRRRRRAAIVAGAGLAALGVMVGSAFVFSDRHAPQPSVASTATAPNPPAAHSTQPPGSGLKWTPVNPSGKSIRNMSAQVLRRVKSDALIRNFVTKKSAITVTLANLSSSEGVMDAHGDSHINETGPHLAWIVVIKDADTIQLGGPGEPKSSPHAFVTATPPSSCTFYAAYSAKDGHRLLSERVCS